MNSQIFLSSVKCLLLARNTAIRLRKTFVADKNAKIMATKISCFTAGYLPRVGPYSPANKQTQTITNLH